MAKPFTGAPAFAAAALALSVGACGYGPTRTASWGGWGGRLTERECLARAMYFESNRSSPDGMSAVGTVVMNRVNSGQYGQSVCSVVGQRNQFAPGVLSKSVGGRSWQLALSKADDVLGGERHARVGRAMHFHTAGYTFPYRNMAYVVAAGGNVFYEKRTPGTFTPVNPNVLVAQAQERRRPSDAILLARAETPAPAFAPKPVIEKTRVATLAERPSPHVHSPSHERPSQPMRVSRERAQFASHDKTAHPERVRLAHLDASDMPKALRQQNDAGPSGGIPLSYRSPTAGSSAKSAAARSEPVKSRIGAKTPLLAAKAEPPRGGSNRSLPAGPAKERMPPQHTAKAKPDAATPAKLGWKRGPEPAPKPAQEKSKKRN